MFRFVGDCQMPQALKIFIEEKGQEIVQKELFRNFILHLGKYKRQEIVQKKLFRNFILLYT